MRGIVLYGPPAAGKSTITTQLHRLDPAYTLFKRLKVGSGRSSDYRMTTATYWRKLHAAGDVVWENERYGNVYLIDRTGLRDALTNNAVPIVHVGQPGAIAAIQAATSNAQWLVVELWCARTEAAERLTRRSPADAAIRLNVWDETPRLHAANLRIATDAMSAGDAAITIHRRFTDAPSGTPARPLGRPQLRRADHHRLGRTSPNRG
jgi:guanylate kinase